jgi:hypothetical protein
MAYAARLVSMNFRISTQVAVIAKSLQLMAESLPSFSFQDPAMRVELSQCGYW